MVKNVLIQTVQPPTVEMVIARETSVFAMMVTRELNAI